MRYYLIWMKKKRSLHYLIIVKKLALAYCFLRTSPSTTIWIVNVKNLRICSGCHVVIEMVSREFHREMIVTIC
ncbi:PPR superfamily protein, putative [Medicago truncatula]|uniref:PPR superfamily protein, putative n=1 Tax=Medicago truncatula TaxID=3880 RepID=G7IF48_MEDTR|nr:PPR superfamily protein, putative [Medicago truncatula]